MLLPAQIAASLDPATATAASWRIALALISSTRGLQSYYVAKPIVARLSAVRMDNAIRLLDPVAGITTADGEPIFDRIEYEPGIRKSLAGQIHVDLSPAAMELMTGPEIEIDDGEFGRYSLATALTLRLRIGAEQQRTGSKIVRWRLSADDAIELLGQSIRRAGTHREAFSFARAWQNSIGPAIDQINAVSADYRVLTHITQQSDAPGSPWISADVEVHSVHTKSKDSPRTASGNSIRKLAAKAAYRARVQETKAVR